MASLFSQVSIPVNDDDNPRHSQILINEEVGLTANIDEKNQSRISLGEEKEGFLTGVREEPRKNIFKIKIVTLLYIAVSLIITTLCVILTINPLKNRKEKPINSSIFFNGTHDFHPTVILISFDGFRWDYLNRNKTPTIQALVNNGTRAEYLTPVFPSKTFPNHYTIVTGLYPESHGIVENAFYDPDLDDEFYYTKPEKSWDSKWWGGEPIWVTAVKQNQKSATEMWVGSSSMIKGYRPTYNFPFDASVTPKEKVDRIINWLDLEKEQRPTFIASYAYQADFMGHAYGPSSKELNQSLGVLDDMIADLTSRLSSRNLTDIVNIIIVSDHGMTQSIPSNVVYLDDFINITKAHPIRGFPLAEIRPYNDSDVPEIYSSLVKASKNQLWNCYLKEEIPERFHYRDSKRITPILCIPPIGWALTSSRGSAVFLNGSHGYDNLETDMRGIFVASGPYFKEKSSKLLNPFSNHEVYNIIANILKLEPAENNGTIGGIL